MTDYYVDYSNGSDSNNGTSLSSPLKTLHPFDEDGSITVSGGDNIYLRDSGTIRHNDRVTFSFINASANNRITIQGYQDEKPTLDFSDDPSSGARGIYFYNCDGYFDLSQFIIQEVGGNAIHVDALNGATTQDYTFSDIEMYHYGRSSDFNGNGIVFFGQVYDCLVEDCIGKYGHDGGSTTGDRSEGDSDAFYIGGSGTHGYSGGHTFRRCEAGWNCDDGFDFFDNDPARPSEMIACIAYGSGQDHPTSPTAYGDGNGFKVGGGWETGNNECYRCISYNNFADGFDTNGASASCRFFHCTSWNNGSFGFQFTGDTDPDHEATNCIAYQNSGGATDALYNCVSTTNTWDLGISNPQFASTNDADSDFLHLTSGSPCIDVGTDIGFTYLGSAPDLGFKEFGTGTPTYQVPKIETLASMTEPLGVSDFSGTILSKAEMLSPTANINPIANHTITQAVVNQLTQTTYYIDPLNGSDTNTGQNLNDAFASFEPLENIGLSPGDVVKVRDTATIDITEGISFSNLDGTANEPIVIEAYEEESPIIDAVNMTSGTTFRLNNVTHFEIRDLTLQNCPEEGLIVDGASTDVLIEDIEVDTFGLHGAGSGITLSGANCVNNTVRNCSVHHGAWQGLSDGFAVVIDSGGHEFENCVAYRNCDDGFGLYNSDGQNGCTFTRCSSYLNGDDGNGNTGDGNGFKFGGDTNSGGHTARFCKSWDNTRRGFETSDIDVGCTLNNCTSWSNDTVGFRDNVGLSTFQNCLSWADDTAVTLHADTTETTNSWNLATGDPLFVSTTYSEGSVGDTFLRLQDTSPAIDVGTDVGLPYSGTAPDLGAHEFAVAEVYYVDPITGSDNNNGLTTGAAFETLEPFDTSTGVVTLAEGDVIQVRSGTVDMSQKLNLATNGSSGLEITFENYASESPVVSFDGVTGSRKIDITGDYLSFDGIDFENATNNLFNLEGATNTMIENCSINSAGRAINVTSNSGVTVNNVVIEDGDSNGIFVGTGSTLTGTDIDVLRANDTAIRVASDASTVSVVGGFLVANDGDGVDADNVVTLKKIAAIENTGDGINVTDSTAATLHNNTAYNNGNNGIVVAGAAHDLTNNLAYDNDSVNFNGDGSQLETTNSWNLANPDPRFISVSYKEAGYFEPYGRSDVIDAGTDVGLAFNDSAPDLGAVEGTLDEDTGTTTENGYKLSPTLGSRELEDFETFTIADDLDGNTGNLGYETNTDRIHDGSQALETTASGTHIAWFSDSYSEFEKETYAYTTYTSWHWGWNGVTTGAVYMAQTDSTGEADFSGYVVRALSRASGSTDELELRRYDNGSSTTLDSWTGTDLFDQQNNTLERIDFTVDTSGNITVDFYVDEAATPTHTLTATDTTYKTGRLGLYGNNANAVIDDMSADSSQSTTEPPIQGNTAPAVTDGISPSVEVFPRTSTFNAESDTIQPTVEVLPVGNMATADTEMRQVGADLAVVGSLVTAEMNMLDEVGFQPILKGIKVEASSNTIDASATPNPTGDKAESLSELLTPLENVVSYEEHVSSDGKLSSPIEDLVATGQLAVVNSDVTDGEPTVIAIGEKANAEALLEATGADVVVFVESVEGLVTMLDGTPLVDAQGVKPAIVMDAQTGTANPQPTADKVEAGSTMTTVNVEIIGIGEKSAAESGYVTGELTAINVGAFRVTAHATDIVAQTKNVSVTANKASANAEAFSETSNLEQINTFYSVGSPKRYIDTKGSKQYD